MNLKKKSLRYIENKFSDNIDKLFEEHILKSLKIQLNEIITDHLKHSPPNCSKKIYSNKKEKSDYSFYSGSGGNIYAFWRYYLFSKSSSKEESDYSLNLLKSYFSENYKILQKDISYDRLSLIPSFFQGPVGVFTMGCILAKELQIKDEFYNYLDKVLMYKGIAQHKSSEYELLYGTAGYLYSLLLIKTECGNTFDFSIDKDIYDIFRYLYECGNRENKKNKAKCLIFPWKRNYEDTPKAYIGAVHGIFGVMYLLLKTLLIIPDILEKDIDFNEIKLYILNTILYLISLQFDDGNFPSSLGNQTNKLVHFCHGAPGSIHTLSLAYQYFNDERILKALLKAGELIWQKGILKKGNSICHGIIGNGIVFYELYKLTKDVKWKNRGLNFALATFDKDIQTICYETDDEQRLVKGISDTPFSLMEGQAGLIAFLSDILNDNVRFPGYEIIH